MIQLILKFLHSISLAFWIGSIFFFSVLAAPSIFKVLPQRTAGDLVADIFPKYYSLGYICGTVFLTSLILLILRGYESLSTVNYLKIALITAMLGLSFYSGHILREQVSQVKTEMRTLPENSEEYETAQAGFKKLHAKSAIINVIVFVFGIAIVFINNYNYCLNETNSFGR